MTAPPCHNRPPYTDPNAGWVDTGRIDHSRVLFSWSGPVGGYVRPVLRYRWPWFTDRCAVWDGTGIGPNGEPYPVAHGWAEACKSCRWMPANNGGE